MLFTNREDEIPLLSDFVAITQAGKRLQSMTSYEYHRPGGASNNEVLFLYISTLLFRKL